MVTSTTAAADDFLSNRQGVRIGRGRDQGYGLMLLNARHHLVTKKLIQPTATPIARRPPPRIRRYDSRLLDCVASFMAYAYKAEGMTKESGRANWRDIRNDLLPAGKLRVFRLPSRLLLNDDLITIASSRFQLGFVQNGYVATRVGNHPSLLQDAGGDADRGSTGSKHLGEELLGQRKSRAANPLVAHQQPSCQSFIHIMQAIASGELSRLNTENH